MPKWEDSAPGKRALAVSQLLNLEASKGALFYMEACAQTTAPLFIQKDVEEGVVNPNLAVVFDEPQFPKAIHKKTHSRPGCANHLRQNFLADLRNHRLGLAFLAELRQQQQNPRQPLFAGIEKLIDQVGLDASVSRQKKGT